jgi:hypothetical protein
MAPEDRFVPRFAAEPPQDLLPYGRWAQSLQEEFLAACLRIEDDGEDLGEAGDILWFPDRTWHGRTYIPATAPTANGYEVYGYVSYAPGDDNEEPGDFHAVADFTAETAQANPDWKIDLCDEVIGTWRGPGGRSAQITLVWGVPQVAGGAIATAELGERVRVTVDQCELIENRLTLIAPDDIGGDTLEVRVYGERGDELAVESLYEDDGEDDGEDA